MAWPNPPSLSLYSTPGATLGGFNFTSNGVYVYGGQLAGADRSMWQFDPTGPTSTKIYDNSDTTEYLNTAQPVVFNGGLYIACSDASNLAVYMYVGTPNSWDPVLAIAKPANTTTTSWTLCITKDALVAVAGTEGLLDDASGAIVRYTLDGTNWSEGSWDSLVASPTIHNLVAPSSRNKASRIMADGIWESNKNTLYVLARYNTTAEGETPCLAKWDTDKFVILQQDIEDYDDYLYAGQGLYFKYDASENQLQYRSDEFTDFDAGWTSIPGNCGVDAPTYLGSTGIGFDIGYLQDVSNNLKVYYWNRNTNAWEVGETIVNASAASSAAIYARMTDGKVIVQRSTSATNYSTRTRDDDLSDTYAPRADEPTTESRLWIYKTTDGGASWTSRGIVTT